MWFFKSWTCYFNTAMIAVGIFLKMPDSASAVLIIAGATNMALRLKTQMKIECKEEAEKAGIKDE